MTHDMPIEDVLDAVTVYFHFLSARHWSPLADRSAIPISEAAKAWVAFVQKAFIQENVGYRVDDAGEVHFHVDEAFAHGMSSALAVLKAPRFANARSAFEDAYRHLDEHPPKRMQAAWCVFVSAEILAKELVPAAQNLHKRLVVEGGALQAACLPLLGGDATERKVWAGMFDSFEPWVDALHKYRHGQVAPDVVEPSEELAVHILSTGAALVRTLALCLLRKPAAP